MMDDRELLELAARAAGIDGAMSDAEYCKAHGPDVITYGMWNPLTSDVDAFRLLCKCSMQIVNSNGGALREVVFRVGDDSHAVEIDWPHTPAATRWAITRAAAAIAQEMTDAQG